MGRYTFGTRMGEAPPAPVEGSIPAIVYVLIGQSGPAGTGFISDGVDHVWNQQGTTYGISAWDKYQRNNYNDLTLTDASRPNEVHGFKPLGPGWGELNSYSWETDLGDTANFGPELQLAHRAKARYGHHVYIIKYAVSGTRLFSVDGHQSWNVDRLGAGGILSCLDIFLDAYWTPAIARIAEIHGGLPNVRIGGVVDWIGFSDANEAEWANAYGANQLAKLNHIRSTMLPSNPTGIPWCQIKTVRILIADPSGEPNAYITNPEIETIRTAQDALATETNVTVIDSVNLIPGSDGLHPSSHSTDTFGNSAFNALEPFGGVLAG